LVPSASVVTFFVQPVAGLQTVVDFDERGAIGAVGDVRRLFRS